jgi:3-dehydroquinate synthase
VETVRVNLGANSYNIQIGAGLLANISDYIGQADKLIVVTDRNVNRLYGRALINALSGAPHCQYVMKPGETSKNMGTVTRVLARMLDNRLTRSSAVLGFGGGVVGDVAGFCASVYMRGIPYIQIPTTLLAQVDSSVGGKTGVNLPQAKNCIGTFSQPKAVIIDTDMLKSLAGREMLSGIGEIIKYGIVADYDFFRAVKDNLPALLRRESAVLRPLIRRCCEIKAKVVAKDEKDTGLRRILNCGHTVGHALEAVTAYSRYTHGEAVLVGLYYETGIACRRGLVTPEYAQEIMDCIQNTGVSVDIGRYSRESLLTAMAHDKKNKQGKIAFILPVGPGKAAEFLLTAADINW